MSASPQVIRSVREMQAWSRGHREAGRSIALVPTMGNLHEGHLSLVRRARRECDRVVVSIFVNPTQFGKGEDYEAYPRSWEEDLGQLARLDVHYVFAPDVHEMYPAGDASRYLEAVDVRIADARAAQCGNVHFEDLAVRKETADDGQAFGPVCRDLGPGRGLPVGHEWMRVRAPTV